MFFAEILLSNRKGIVCLQLKRYGRYDFDPENIILGDPCVLLPVYTRLSDAEEAERALSSQSKQAEERKPQKQNSQVKVSQQALLR